MRTLTAIILITTASIFLSCEKIVDNVDIPLQQPKIVVTCFISPEDSIIKAFVYLSSPIFTYSNTDNYTPVNNAVVKISDFTNERTLTYGGMSEEYYRISTAQFPVLPGNNYRLSVSVPGYDNVEATCKVPLYPNQSLQFLSFDSVQEDEYNWKYIFKTEFTDFNGMGDYYRVAGVITSVYDYGSGTPDTTQNQIYVQFDKEYLSDKINDGQKFQNVFEHWMGYYMEKEYGEKYISAEFFLLSTDENYYQFHKSLSAYSGDDPFSEPVIVYSNINGGLGAFGAYRQYSVKFLFPN